jgi:hypothetical protein
MKNRRGSISFEEACRAAETTVRYWSQSLNADAEALPEDLAFARH